MKVIVTGGTGFLGSEMLRACVANKHITSVIALSRRDLGAEFQNEPKITTIKTTDFGSYSDEDLAKMKGAIGCLWTMGTTPDKARALSHEQLIESEQGWPTRSAEIFSKLPEGRKFTFVYTSGWLVPNADALDKPLWIAEDMRKVRGYTEKKLFDLAAEGKVDTVVAKPKFITTGETLWGRLTAGYFTVRKEAMAALYIDTVLNPGEKKLLSNDDLRSMGAAALEKFAKEK
ncbi:hypothetical protein H072_10014 [Dactylellina haptotyla CBS 200.50]|uniref:NAD-dependent epimerase/dehydratase domain-containing protein n=1 Tax=Dactylellina haptotyla (strain CBS 200.50) TaxID=1284197 RepID=S8A5R7_DACHA|nr:hypothetical protein H072_10014 [Dactylellina haptotyla CBS 200.50]